MNRIQLQLKSLGITQRQLGAMLEPPVAQAQISMWLKGSLRIPLDRAFEIEDKLHQRIRARDWLEVANG